MMIPTKHKFYLFIYLLFLLLSLPAMTTSPKVSSPKGPTFFVQENDPLLPTPFMRAICFIEKSGLLN